MIKIPLKCSLHPNKPANKMCHICERGFCKYDRLEHNGEGYICNECNNNYKPNKIKIKL